jgi:hypothetical protein
MLKTLSAILSAAAVAAVITVASMPGATVDAGPLPEKSAATLKSCVERPWPYLNCVGTEVGNKKIRLITTERLASN